MITVSILLVFLPIAVPRAVLAQTTGYSITQVNHQIQVLYTGQVVIQDTVYVSGQVTNGFTIGIPAQYSNDVLNAVAYDSNSIFQVSLGAQLGDRSGFYGAEVNFNGQTPSVFTVAFVLSDSLLTQLDTGTFTLNFPAYPSLTQNVGTCNVTLTFPYTPDIITIAKSDGTVDTQNYGVSNLPAYTYSIGSANVQVTNQTIQLAEITQLNRQITIDPTGQVSVSDTYNIVNNSTFTMANFMLVVPINANNIAIKDETGSPLSIASSSATSDVYRENATLTTPLSSGQSTIITASYNLPSATIQGSQYMLKNFKVFPDLNCYVDYASVMFNPPQGATIMAPQLPSLEASSTLTRSTFQDSLTLTGNGISFLNYILPQDNIIQFSYSYNPVWVSFMPTFWLSLVAVIGCIGAVIYQKRKPGEKGIAVTKKTKAAAPKLSYVPPTEQVKGAEPKTAELGTVVPTGQHITGENIREFTEAYEDKKRLNAEIRSLDVKAQKGKIPRRQYKVQRRAIEIRLETLSRNTSRMKEILRNSGAAYADLIKQLDSAEEDLTEAEDNIKSLEDQQSRGEISIEIYKKTIGDYQKRRDKAESTLNGILLRLREKTR
jgi:hypothetical protein